MNKLLLAAPLALAVAAGTAQAQTLVATSNIVVRALDRSINFTSDVTSRISDMKVVVEALSQSPHLQALFWGAFARNRTLGSQTLWRYRYPCSQQPNVCAP